MHCAGNCAGNVDDHCPHLGRHRGPSWKEPLLPFLGHSRRGCDLERRRQWCAPRGLTLPPALRDPLQDQDYRLRWTQQRHLSGLQIWLAWRTVVSRDRGCFESLGWKCLAQVLQGHAVPRTGGLRALPHYRRGDRDTHEADSDHPPGQKHCSRCKLNDLLFPGSRSRKDGTCGTDQTQGRTRPRCGRNLISRKMEMRPRPFFPRCNGIGFVVFWM